MHGASVAGHQLDHKRASVQAATRAAPMLPVQGYRVNGLAHTRTHKRAGNGIDMELQALDWRVNDGWAW